MSQTKKDRRKSSPGHAAVYGEVEGIREADNAVDEERNVPDKLVIKKIFINTAIRFLRSFAVLSKYTHRYGYG